MEIKILDLKLKNFKGIKELEINFEGKDTNIYGANATGKTTIFDAFKWLFFDKDSSDRKDFNIKTLDSNNNPIHFLEHEVEATLAINGVDTTFRKMFQEKWTKKRGQEQQVFSGHETSYWIDEVPIKKKDYEEKINSLIPENLFKLITDPTYFNEQMSWKERRELLVNISGTNITDEDILNSNEQFETLKENLEGRTIEDYKKVLASKIKDLNNEKEKIPVRIDELTKTLITEIDVDYEKLEQEKEVLGQELNQIETEMTDIQMRTNENMKKADQLATVKNELNNLKIKLEVEHNKKYTDENISLTNEKVKLENNIRNIKNEIQDRTFAIERDTKRREELYKKWDEVCSTKIEFDSSSFVCPACKREYEPDKVEEMKASSIHNFQEHQEKEKAKINEEGQAINARLQENNEAIEKLKSQQIEVTNKLNEVEKKLNNINELQEAKKYFDVTALPQYQEKLNELENLQEEVSKLISEDTTEIRNKKSNIVEQINSIDKQLNERTVQERTKTRITELEQEEENISRKVQELEAQQFQIEEFTKAKVNLLENAINSKFEIVKFRLFDTQINGGLIECCDTLVNGVPYADVNNAHKIIAGLDIINTLSQFYNTTAPIFIDNRESINKLCKTNAQIISLIVTNDTALRIEEM